MIQHQYVELPKIRNTRVSRACTRVQALENVCQAPKIVVFLDKWPSYHTGEGPMDINLYDATLATLLPKTTNVAEIQQQMLFLATSHF